MMGQRPESLSLGSERVPTLLSCRQRKGGTHMVGPFKGSPSLPSALLPSLDQDRVPEAPGGGVDTHGV